MLVIDGFNFCTAFGCTLFVSLSLSSLSSLSESDDACFVAAGFGLLVANFGFFAADALSESLLSSDEDSAFRFAAPFVKVGFAAT